MNPVLSSLLSLTALIISLVALHFTFRKDAHRIRLEITILEFNLIVLGINNDSACDADVLSVGYFDSSGQVTWIPKVGEYSTGKWVQYPISVRARSLYNVILIIGREIPDKEMSFGYCVQLATGRIYILRGTAPLWVTLKMHCASLISRLSGGRYVIPGFKRIRLPSRD